MKNRLSALQVIAFAESIGMALFPWQKRALPKIIAAIQPKNENAYNAKKAAEEKRQRKAQRNLVLAGIKK